MSNTLPMPWWGWVVTGFGLALVELVTPGGFIVIFFGVGAILVGLLVAAVSVPEWVQWTLFGVLSTVCTLVFRKPILKRFATPDVSHKSTGDLVGDSVVAGSDLAPNGRGKCEFRGTQWTMRNVGGKPVKAGERCRIEAVDGLTLDVRAEEF